MAPSKPGGECAKCGAPATQRCAGCLGAPEYRPGDASIVYCSRDCQKAHWAEHKPKCNEMRKRVKLLRAARLLRAALLAYRECAFDQDLRRIELKDGVLCLHDRPPTAKTRPAHRRFPDHLASCVEHKEAALLFDQDTTAMSLLGRLAWKLLPAPAFAIECMDVMIDKPVRPVKTIPGHGEEQNLEQSILKVEPLFSGETWVIDVTGSQSGFPDVLCPYTAYLSDKVGEISGDPEPYGMHETSDLDILEQLMPVVKACKAATSYSPSHVLNRHLERTARGHFARFVDERFGGDQQAGQGLLEGSAADWEKKLEGFADEIRRHMERLAMGTADEPSGSG